VEVPDLVPLLGAGGFFAGCAAIAKLWFDRSDARRDAKSARDVQRADLIKIAQDAAGAIIADLREDVDRERREHAKTRARLDELDAEFATFRRTHDTMIADRDAELALLRGRVRALEAERDALARILDHHNIPHPPTAQPFFELRDGRVDPVTVPPPTP